MVVLESKVRVVCLDLVSGSINSVDESELVVLKREYLEKGWLCLKSLHELHALHEVEAVLERHHSTKTIQVD